jgi:hypothetical protein
VYVLGQTSQPMVIDWPDASRGDPSADVCRSYLLLKLHAEEIADPYLAAYCRITHMNARAAGRVFPGTPVQGSDPTIPRRPPTSCTPHTAGTGSPIASTVAWIAASRQLHRKKQRSQRRYATTSGNDTLIQAEEFKNTVKQVLLTNAFKIGYSFCYFYQKGGFQDG